VCGRSAACTAIPVASSDRPAVSATGAVTSRRRQAEARAIVAAAAVAFEVDDVRAVVPRQCCHAERLDAAPREEDEETKVAPLVAKRARLAREVDVAPAVRLHKVAAAGLEYRARTARSGSPTTPPLSNQSTNTPGKTKTHLSCYKSNVLYAHSMRPPS
jgi:hypothetical protein